MTASSDPPLNEWRRRFDRPLPRSFYRRPTRTVARELLGAILVRRVDGGFRAARIVETEAYVDDDEANHAFRGPTDRNRSMFGAPGTLYVYRIHQVHCANAVTVPGQAVLLRAGEPLTLDLGNLSGPGRFCRALGLDRGDDGLDLTRSEVRIVRGTGPSERIVTTRRVGIRKAAHRPLRFALEGNRWVSRPLPWRSNRPRRAVGR